MEGRQIHEGSHGHYHWLTSTEHYSGTLLKLCPEAVVGRYVAVVSRRKELIESFRDRVLG